MSLEAINTLSAAISAFAIVVSLLFVAAQIRAGTKAQRASSAWLAENAWAQFNFELARDPSMAKLVMSVFAGNLAPDSLTAGEKDQIHFFIKSALQHSQSQFFLFCEGSLSPDAWNHQSAYLAPLLRVPLVVAAVKLEIEWKTFSPRFEFEVLRPLMKGEAPQPPTDTSHDHQA